LAINGTTSASSVEPDELTFIRILGLWFIFFYPEYPDEQELFPTALDFTL